MNDDEEKTGLSGLRVLFFDELPKKRKYYLSCLRMCGLREILIADNLADALQALVSSNVDLVMLTCSGEETGMDLLVEIRSLGATSFLPVVAIMSEVNVMNGLRMLAQGVNHILTDPLSQQGLESMVQQVFRERFGIDQIDQEISIAQSLVDEGKLEDAHRLYSRCLRMEGVTRDQLFQAYLGLARTGTERQEWLEAESNLFLALEIAKSETNRVLTHWLLSRAFYQYGKLYEKRGLMEKALKSYQTSVSFDPYHVASLKPLLMFLLKQDNFTEISRLLAEARANFPAYSEPLGELAETLNGMAVRAQVLGLPVYAAKLYGQLMTLPHDRVVVHQDTTDYLVNAGKITQALTTLREVSAQVRSPEIFGRIGTILLDVERRYLGGATKKQTAEVDLSFFKDMDSPKTVALAYRAFQEGLLLNPGDIQLRLGVAYCLMRQGKHEALGEMLNKFKEGDRLGKKLHMRIIEMLLEGRLYDLAHSWIKDAISQFPREVAFYECAARCYKGQRKPQKSIECLKKALALDSEHPGINLALARLHEELRQPDEAAFYYEKARQLAPDTAARPKPPEAAADGKGLPKRGRKWF
ncbi:MAG: tetratricopeptide repeat protein [Desulfobacterota bacterium]|nr:tetratricopeptide repeat protein [Thermodesulfobacteriota bacterium]